MLQYGANVNLADYWGVTPMYVAASNNQLEIILQLIYAGADLSYKNCVSYTLCLIHDKKKLCYCN